jgi:hypothetical protein
LAIIDTHHSTWLLLLFDVFIICSIECHCTSSRNPTSIAIQNRADGDRAQATIVDSLQLVNKCQQDPSLIVVDVGGFLGNYISYLNKQKIIK